MTRRDPRRGWPRRWVVSLLAWSALALLAWLDRDADALATHAHIFAWLLSALLWAASAIGAAGGAIATSLSGVVVWLANSLAWLTVRVADILRNTGSMFAKVWDSAQRFYADVLRPALTWLHDFYRRIQAWLERVFKPVFKFLLRVREELRTIYTRFVRPILDIIDVTRAVLRVLTTLHVPVARALDQALAKVEQVIDENFRWLLSQVNRVIDIVDSIVTFDRLFQRLPFVRSINRDIRYISNIWWGAHSKPLVEAERTKATDAYESLSTTALARAVTLYVTNHAGDRASYYDELAATMRLQLQSTSD